MRIQTLREERQQRLIELAAVLVCAAALIPFMAAARYAGFHSDDFSFYLDTAKQTGGSWLIKSLKSAADTYMGWQGTFFSNFVISLLNPLKSYSYTQLRCFLIALLGGSFFAALLLSHTLCDFFEIPRGKNLLFLIFLLPLLSYREYQDVYLWYVAAVAYQLPMLLMALGLALMLRGRIRGKTALTVLACIAMFLMAGCVLLAGGLGASLVLLLCVIDYIQFKKIRWDFWAVFLATLCGDLINSFAPGNFAKHSLIGELNIMGSIAGTFRAVMKECAFLLGGTSLAVFILAAFLFGVVLNRKVRKESFFIAFAGLILTPFITAFPMILGYSGTETEGMALRGLFILDAALILCIEGMALLTGSQLRACGILRSVRRTTAVTAGAALIVLLLSAESTAGALPIAITKNLASGRIQQASIENRIMFDMIRDYPDDNVVVIEQPEECEGFFPIQFAADPENYKNVNVSKYFGKESICTGYWIASHGGTEKAD